MKIEYEAFLTAEACQAIVGAWSRFDGLADNWIRAIQRRQIKERELYRLLRQLRDHRRNNTFTASPGAFFTGCSQKKFAETKPAIPWDDPSERTSP